MSLLSALIQYNCIVVYTSTDSHTVRFTTNLDIVLISAQCHIIVFVPCLRCSIQRIMPSA